MTIVTTMGLLLSSTAAHAQELQASASADAYMPVRAGSFALKIEPGLAIPLSRPQTQRFEVGGGASVKGLFALTPFFDIGPSATFIGLPAEAANADPGTAWAFGGTAQLKRPHHAGGSTFAAISPWVDLDVLYVRTDDLSRPGMALGGGLSVPIGKARVFWLGPFVRFMQIFSGERAGFNSNDARILSVGLSLEVSSGNQREPMYVAPTEVGMARPMCKDTVSCPDRDGDTIPDSIDRCPDVVGPMGNYGCRQYEKIVVKPDKLELKEKLYFAWNEATIQEVSHPALDEVVSALNENKDFHVQVEGHSSSDGADERNQTLSEQRAQAVLDYLVSHGVAKERLASKGFSSSVPLDTNATVEGRETNRRVEFVVYFNIRDSGSLGK